MPSLVMPYDLVRSDYELEFLSIGVDILKDKGHLGLMYSLPCMGSGIPFVKE